MIFDECVPIDLTENVPHIKRFYLFHRVRRDEIQTLAGPNEYIEFKSRLTALDKFYSQHPNEVKI